MINIDKYRMNDIKFDGNEWEFIYSLVFLKYGRKINILEIGEGNYSLLYAICNEHFENLKNILSIDVKNSYDKGETKFYEKKRIFSALADRKYEYVEHFQGDCFANDILHVARFLFIEDPIDMFVIEYVNDDNYMDKIFDTYDFYFGEKIDIYYHNLNKSEKSLLYFKKISEKKRSVILDYGAGVGIIKNSD